MYETNQYMHRYIRKKQTPKYQEGRFQHFLLAPFKIPLKPVTTQTPLAHKAPKIKVLISPARFI